MIHRDTSIICDIGYKNPYGYVSDLTRTYGYFSIQNGSSINNIQRFHTIYSMVEWTKRELERSIKRKLEKGEDISWEGLNMETHSLLLNWIAHHKSKFYIRDEEEWNENIETLSSDFTRIFFYHSVGHFIGLEVHEEGSKEVSKLVEGCVFTLEYHPCLIGMDLS